MPWTWSEKAYHHTIDTNINSPLLFFQEIKMPEFGARNVSAKDFNMGRWVYFFVHSKHNNDISTLVQYGLVYYDKIARTEKELWKKTENKHWLESMEKLNTEENFAM